MNPFACTLQRLLFPFFFLILLIITAYCASPISAGVGWGVGGGGLSIQPDFEKEGA